MHDYWSYFQIPWLAIGLLSGVFAIAREILGKNGATRFTGLKTSAYWALVLSAIMCWYGEHRKVSELNERLARDDNPEMRGLIDSISSGDIHDELGNNGAALLLVIHVFNTGASSIAYNYNIDLHCDIGHSYHVVNFISPGTLTVDETRQKFEHLTDSAIATKTTTTPILHNGSAVGQMQGLIPNVKRDAVYGCKPSVRVSFQDVTGRTYFTPYYRLEGRPPGANGFPYIPGGPVPERLPQAGSSSSR